MNKKRKREDGENDEDGREDEDEQLARNLMNAGRENSNSREWKRLTAGQLKAAVPINPRYPVDLSVDITDDKLVLVCASVSLNAEAPVVLLGVQDLDKFAGENKDVQKWVEDNAIARSGRKFLVPILQEKGHFLRLTGGFAWAISSVPLNRAVYIQIGYSQCNLGSAEWHLQNGMLIAPTAGTPPWLTEKIKAAETKAKAAQEEKPVAAEQETKAVRPPQPTDDRKVRMPWLLRRWQEAGRLDCTDQEVETSTTVLWDDFLEFCKESADTKTVLGDLETKGRAFFTELIRKEGQFTVVTKPKHGSVVKGVKLQVQAHSE